MERISAREFSRGDAEALGTDWTPKPLEEGDALFYMPQIPHGSTGPATTRRRLILPWLNAIMPDGDTLELPEAGTVSEIVEANRRLTKQSRPPNGLDEQDFSIPAYLPGATVVSGLGTISDASGLTPQ